MEVYSWNIFFVIETIAVQYYSDVISTEKAVSVPLAKRRVVFCSQTFSLCSNYSIG